MKVAVYTVTIAREIPEQDFGHHATDEAAIAQLSNELQEAWGSGSVDGFFKIHRRREVIDFDAWEASWGDPR
jgi:hypothetical protein